VTVSTLHIPRRESIGCNMNAKTLTVALLAALVVATGAVAAQPSTAGANDDGDAGPPSTLPDPVPDFVGDIHDAIRSFLDGSLDGSLGDAVSDLAGGPGNSDGNSDAAADH
jgi:hypothetical protein